MMNQLWNSNSFNINSLHFILALSSFFALITPLLATHPGETVIGCGGFVRWKDPSVSSHILFNKIKVNLFAEPSGALQDVTDVLPNGAYSVALYDHGPYRLTLTTPKGWHIHPGEGYLIDIRADPDACVNNLDFVLSGFTIYGQVVTYGLTTGPSGLNIRMLSNDTSTVLPSTLTEIGGSFALAPVLPGSFEITVSDRTDAASEHIRARMSITLAADSLSLQEPLVLMGHFVRGRIVGFHDEPLTGAIVHLLMDVTAGDQPKVDCNMRPLPSTDLPNELLSGKKLVCVTKTDNTGQFSFDRLPGGNYALFPHYSILSGTKEPLSISFSPTFRLIAVEHADLDLGQSTFSAETFKLPAGRVVWPDGKPLAGATVYFGDQVEPLLTNSDGLYQPGFIKPGQYSIKVKANNVKFSPHLVQLTSGTEHLPTLQPSHLSLCGRIEPAERIAPGTLDPASSVDVEDKSTGIKQDAAVLDHQTMQFCGFYVPGHYVVAAAIRVAGRRLHFAPDTHSVHISNRPILDLVFTQFRANVTGRVQLLGNAADTPSSLGPLVVRFQSVEQANVFYSSLTATENAPSILTFELTNMLPGDYRMDLVHQSTSGSVQPLDGWCWKAIAGSSNPTETVLDGSRLLRIRYTNLDWNNEPALLFEQSGYAVRLQLETPLAFNHVPTISLRATASLGNQTETLNWEFSAYAAQICLPSPNQIYKFTPSSSCLDLSGPVPSKILPSKDCHSRIDDTPTLRITITKVPVGIRLTYSHPFEAMEDGKLLTKQSIPIDVVEHGETMESVGTTQSVFAKWSSSEVHNELFAEASVKVNPNHMITIKPKSAVLKGQRWSYTYLVREPGTLSFKPKDLAPMEQTTVTSYPFLLPTMDAAIPTNQQCADLYRSQTSQFVLDAAVLLRGQVQPPIAKVEVALYRKTPPRSANARDSNRSPLLPLHVDTVDHSNETKHEGPTAPPSDVSPLATTLTDPKGVFLLGPVPLEMYAYKNLPDPRTMFRVSLSKPGYEFFEHAEPDYKASPSNWLFKATKLSLVEVVVQTKGAEKQPLQGVLVSIIGEGHRGNQFTDRLGVANFVGLAPGQYYLRAMMKEHVFNVIKPKSESAGQASPIQISEGASVRVEIEADRVAFSASGTVSALGDNPEANVLVEASWIPHLPERTTAMEFPPHTKAVCQLSGSDASGVPREQSWTDANGTFLIRGLIPGCYYAISVHTTPADQVPSLLSNQADNKPIIDRAIPEVLFLLMPPHDAVGLKFIAIQQTFMSTLTVSIDADDEFISSLHLSLFPLDRPDLLVAKHYFSDSLFFMLPHSKMRQVVGRDHVLRLESTLEPTLFTGVSTQQMVIHPKVAESQHFTFAFRPKPRLLSPNSPRSEL